MELTWRFTPEGTAPRATDRIRGFGGTQSRSTRFGEDKLSYPCPDSNHSPVFLRTTLLTVVQKETSS